MRVNQMHPSMAFTTNDGTRDGNLLKVLMVPWIGHSHASSFFELAKSLTLSNKSFYVHFCSTPIILESIEPKLSSSPTHSHDFRSNINLVQLQLPSSPDLPPHQHTTKGLPPHLAPLLVSLFKMAKREMIEIFETIKPDLLIYDVFVSFLVPLASSRSIPSVSFSTFGATSTSLLYCHLRGPEFPFPFHEAIHFKDSDHSGLVIGDDPNSTLATEVDPNDIFNSGDLAFPIVESFLDNDITLIKSSEVIEGKYIDFLSSSYGKKVVPVGPLVDEYRLEILADDDDDRGRTSSEITEWLAGKDVSSTIYVSFGTESFLTENDMKELAHGLEASEVNFIWAIKFPKGRGSSIEEALPEGFLERVVTKGKVVQGWVSQTEILRHPSIEGFLSHCGWGSVLESMVLGVPILAMPLKGDQYLNARLTVEHGVGLEVMRKDNGEISRAEVVRAIKQFMEKDSPVKLKAKEMSELIRKESEEKKDCWVQELIKVCAKHKENNCTINVNLK